MDWTIVAMVILTVALALGLYLTFRVYSEFGKRDQNLKNKELYLINFQRSLERELERKVQGNQN